MKGLNSDVFKSNLINLANEVIRLRNKKNLSQVELSNLSGVSLNVIIRIEQAEEDPRLDDLILLSYILEVQVVDLLTFAFENKTFQDISFN